MRTNNGKKRSDYGEESAKEAAPYSNYRVMAERDNTYEHTYDEDDQEYLISAFSDKDCFMGFSPAPDFEIEAEYLKRSRMVLRMNLMEGPQTRREARGQKNNMEHFRKTFRQYF